MLMKFLLILMPSVALAGEPSFVDFLTSAWEKSPVIKGEGLHNEFSDQLVSSVHGKYLPHVSLEALDTTGFPASNSGLQVGGLMGSPFRSGYAGGVVVEQMVYDFGRIHALLERAKAQRSLDQARLAEDKFRFLSSVGKLYLSCARSKSLVQIDNELMTWAKINLKETARFTKTGQRSVIDNSLVQTEVNSLQLELDKLKQYQASLASQMELYGSPRGGCQDLTQTWQVKMPESLKVAEPSLLLAKAQIELAQSSYQEAKSAQLPILKVMGSAGGMERTRLVTDREDYAAGIGLTFPIWNGGEDAHREHAYRAQSDYQHENLKAAQLEFSVHVKNLQDQLDRDRGSLEAVNKDLEQVQKTIKLASSRYSRLEGPLIDVREAFKQLRDLGLERLRLLSTLGGVSLQLGMLNLNQN